MSDQPRPRPLPGGRPFEVERLKPPPRELPRAPEQRSEPLTLTQMAGAAVLVIVGLGIIGFFALGLPLAAVGGKIAVIVPILAIALFIRRGGGGRR